MQKLRFKDLGKKILGFLLTLSSVLLCHISLIGIIKASFQAEPIEGSYIVILIICSILAIIFLTCGFLILKVWSVFGSLMIVYGLIILLFPKCLLWISHPLLGAAFIILGNIFMIYQNTIHILKRKKYLAALFNWKGILFDLFLIIGLTFLGQTIMTLIFPEHNNKILLLAISNTILMTTAFTIIGRRTNYTSFIYLLIIAIGLFIISIPFMGLMGLSSSSHIFRLIYILAAMGLGGALSFSFTLSTNKTVDKFK